VEANLHEHIARAMYYFSVQLLYASAVGAAAWVLTSIRDASATTKYWIWVVTAFNFIVPVGAIVDKVFALHLQWAAPLTAIGGPVWDLTQGRTGTALGAIWIAGAFVMLMRLVLRLRQEGCEAHIAHSNLSYSYVNESWGQVTGKSRNSAKFLTMALKCQQKKQPGE
jgi:hypothetical protein